MSDSSSKSFQKFANDEVEGWDPLRFGVEFTRRLRKQKSLSHQPSLRTSIAIPRFLTARYFRRRRLTPRDYLDAAVLNTVLDDQITAELIARELLFPTIEDALPTVRTVSGCTVPSAEVVEEEIDPFSSILGGLAELSLDLDNLEQLSLDTLEELENEEEAMKAFDLFERLFSSAVLEESALAQLIAGFGGPAELEAWGANTLPKARLFVRERLLGKVGALQAKQILQACQTNFGDLLKREVRQPWELAGVFAGISDQAGLATHLEDLLTEATIQELGKTLQFLRPHTEKGGELSIEVFDDFSEKSMGRAQNLNDFAELLFGLDEWLDPSTDLLLKSVQKNVMRTLQAAVALRERFGNSLEADVFVMWADQLTQPPTLAQLVEIFVDCPRWEDLLQGALQAYVNELQQTIAGIFFRDVGDPNETADTEVSSAEFYWNALPPCLSEAIWFAESLQRTGLESGASAAAQLATEVLCLLQRKEHFLPVLDGFLERFLVPDNVKRIVDAGEMLGVDPNEIYDRIGEAIEQLKAMILSDERLASRYKRLVSKIVKIPEELMRQLATFAVENQNLEAMAALLAIDMGGAAGYGSDDFVINAFGYKGIGGGPNLLKQWFDHRDTIRSSLKDQIKAQVKDALLELAFDWINKGQGTTEGGLLPQNQVRPYIAGDELELLDLESTLDAIINAGKRLEDITEDDLYVHDTSKGRAALGVLIDISGSMSGGELAMCAVAVVMLLGRVRAEEVALAAFESNTHVVKNFDDAISLDDVADKVLELRATGGTRVDAALNWVREEFDSVGEAEFRLLFVLSDFMFWEEAWELRQHGQQLADLGVRFLGASHGSVSRSNRDLLVESIGGTAVELRSLKRLPALLIDTLRQIGDGVFWSQ